MRGPPDNIYYYQDELGSTSHIAGGTGALIESYQYDLYGKPRVYNSGGTYQPNATPMAKDLHGGARWISQLGLYDDRNRFMSPGLGRFIQPDPIGFKGDSSNLYRYCGNDWANRTDPTGLGNNIDPAQPQATPAPPPSRSQQVAQVKAQINARLWNYGATVLAGLYNKMNELQQSEQSLGQVSATEKKYGLPNNPGGVPAGFVPHNGSDGNQVMSPISSNNKEVYQTREWQMVDSNGNPFKAYNSLTNTETGSGKNVKTSTNVKLNSQGIMTDKIAISKAELARAPDGPINFTIKNTANWNGTRIHCRRSSVIQLWLKIATSKAFSRSLMNPIGKKSKKLLLAGLLLVSPIGYLDAADVPSDAEESQRNQEAVLKYLGPALKDSGGAGRIDYVGVCAAKDGTPLPFPAVVVQPPSKGTSGLAAVREIFSQDKKVSVSESASGMIRVTIGQPMSSILQTRIRSLALDREDRYNAAQAIVTILGCKDVQVAMRQHGFDQPLTVSSIGIAPFEKGAPHLPARIWDLTMDQALNNVAKTFGGIVIYAECANANGKRLFTLDFTQAMDSEGNQ